MAVAKKKPATKKKTALKKSKKVNPWLIGLGAVLVGAVGAVVVFKSFAGSFSFARDARTQLIGGTLRCPTGGDCRRNLSVNVGSNFVKTLVSNYDMAASTKVCTTVVVNSTFYGYISLYKEVTGGMGTLGTTGRKTFKAGQRVQVCSRDNAKPVSSWLTTGGTLGVSGNRADSSNSSIGVFSIYGIKR